MLVLNIVSMLGCIFVVIGQLISCYLETNKEKKIRDLSEHGKQ